MCPGGGVTEQPPLSSDHKRLDRPAFQKVVVDGQVAAFGVTDQARPHFAQIPQRLTQLAPGGDQRQGLIQPGAQFLQDRQAVRLARLEALRIARVFHLGLDTVKPGKQIQRVVGAGALAVGAGAFGLDELSPRVRRTCQMLHTGQAGHRRIAFVAVRHQVAR